MVTTGGRSKALQTFFDTLQTAVVEATAGNDAAASAAERIFRALETPGPRSAAPSGRLPVCDCLPQAVATAGGSTAHVAAHAAALAALEPEFVWKQRAPIEGQPGNFATGHANAVISSS